MKWFVLAFTLLPLAAAELEMVALVLANGERTPVMGYPNDPHKDFDYKGLQQGDVTMNGKTLLYKLGTLLHDKYESLLTKDESFTTANILAKSSTEKGCFDSANFFLAGFYPNYTNWNPNPIKILQNDEDYVIGLKNCPRYSVLYNEVMKNLPEDLVKMKSDLAPIAEVFQQHSGFPSIGDAEIKAIAETVEFLERYGVEPPTWFSPEYYKPIREYLQRHVALLSETKELTKLKSGALIMEVVSQMVNAMNPAESVPTVRVLLYSGTDSTITSLLKAMNVTDQVPLLHSLGPTLAIELYSVDSKDNTHEVKLIYRDFNGESVTEYNLQHPECGKECFASRFTEVMQDFLVINPDAHCASQRNEFRSRQKEDEDD